VPRRLDEDEFVASGIETTDPGAAADARAALADLQLAAADRFESLLEPNPERPSVGPD
jgi:hypothetical protein